MEPDIPEELPVDPDSDDFVDMTGHSAVEVETRLALRPVTGAGVAGNRCRRNGRDGRSQTGTATYPDRLQKPVRRSRRVPRSAART